ncbi:hypothetical protein SISNIDRAFT_549454 [Sistotremastrum niveocremeum HHB9708]|uniref:Uncharacterized protein n=1 Tax=Sistotremastrum niveocremeum HHB9708 TaxID=1314777 RepID=A0A164VM87_9AGAM|nr:hypothetical protein SISNIDRAFT_549454 [Sistotremastrum niveocremeum HHB9708]
MSSFVQNILSMDLSAQLLLAWIMAGSFTCHYLFKSHKDPWDMSVQLCHPSLASLRMALAVIGASKPAKVRAIRDEIREAVHLHGWTEPATTEMRLLDSTLTSRTCLCHRNSASNNPPGYDNFVVPYLPDPPAEVLLSPLALGAPIKLPKLTRRSCQASAPTVQTSYYSLPIFSSHTISAPSPPVQCSKANGNLSSTSTIQSLRTGLYLHIGLSRGDRYILFNL